MHVQLAEEDRARLAQSFDDKGIVLRDVVFEQRTARRRRHAAHIEQIFDREWNAVQRAAILAARNLIGGDARFVQCALGSEGDEGVDLRIDRLDALQADLRQLQRRDVLRVDGLTGGEKRWEG